MSTKGYISKHTLNKLHKRANDNLKFPPSNLISSKMTVFEYIFKFNYIPFTLAEFDVILSKETMDALEDAGSIIYEEMMFAALEGDESEGGLVFNLMKQEDTDGDEDHITISLDGEILVAS